MDFSNNIIYFPTVIKDQKVGVKPYKQTAPEVKDVTEKNTKTPSSSNIDTPNDFSTRLLSYRTCATQTLDAGNGPSVVKDLNGRVSHTLYITKFKQEYNDTESDIASVIDSPATKTQEVQTLDTESYPSLVKEQSVRIGPYILFDTRNVEAKELLSPNYANAQDNSNFGKLPSKRNNSFDFATNVTWVKLSPSPTTCAVQTLDTDPGNSDINETSARVDPNIQSNTEFADVLSAQTTRATKQKLRAIYILEKLPVIPLEELSDKEHNSFEKPTSQTSVKPSPVILTSAAHRESETGSTSIEGQRVADGTFIQPSSEVTRVLLTEGARDRDHPTCKEKRVALKILEKLSSIPWVQMSDIQKHTFEWASRTTSAATGKRNNSLEESAVPAAKKPRICTTSEPAEQLNDTPKSQIIVAIVDKARPNGTISLDGWRLLEAKLASLLLPILREHPGPAPSCEDAGWFEGQIKLLICADQRSLGLLKLAILKVGEVWRGARIEIWTMDQIPSPPKAIVRLPVEPSDKKDIMDLIRMGNPYLDTSDWKIRRLEDPKGTSRLAVIVINEASLSPLSETGHKIFYGFGTVSLKIYRKGGRLSPKPCLLRNRQGADFRRN